MITQLTNNYMKLAPAARTRLVAIRDLETQIGDQQISIQNLKRQLDDREAQLFEEAGIPAKQGDKPPSVEARKNITHLKKKDDPAYQDLLGVLEDAQRELVGMQSDLHEKLRDHALDKRELETIGNLARALAGTKDEPKETEPVAPSATGAPPPKKPTGAPVPIF